MHLLIHSKCSMYFPGELSYSLTSCINAGVWLSARITRASPCKASGSPPECYLRRFNARFVLKISGRRRTIIVVAMFPRMITFAMLGWIWIPIGRFSWINICLSSAPFDSHISTKVYGTTNRSGRSGTNQQLLRRYPSEVPGLIST